MKYLEKIVDNAVKSLPGERSRYVEIRDAISTAVDQTYEYRKAKVIKTILISNIVALILVIECS